MSEYLTRMLGITEGLAVGSGFGIIEPFESRLGWTLGLHDYSVCNTLVLTPAELVWTIIS